MKKKEYKITLTILFLILLIGFVIAATTISDTSINTSGRLASGELSVADGRLTINSTTTTFNGQIFNIDDINGASRYVEINLNNGSLASSQINLMNDVGNTLSLGIGSSGLNITGTEGANSGAVLLESPANMVFGILYDYDYKWKVNQLNDSSIQNLIDIMELDSEGNLNVTGNLEVGGVIAGSLSLGSTNVNISSGNITYETYYMGVLGEGGINDDLNNINGGNKGDVVNIFPTDSNSDITLIHGVGNLDLDGVNCALKSVGTKAELRRTDGDWKLIVCLN